MTTQEQRRTFNKSERERERELSDSLDAIHRGRERETA